VVYFNGSNFVSGPFAIPTGALAAISNLSDVYDADESRANIGLEIGVDVQAYDATLASIADLGTAADRIAYTTGVDEWAESTLTNFARICEAVTRPSMRFVPAKTVDQQAALMLHRARDLLVHQRTQLINALRAHLAEIGLVAATGVDGVKAVLAMVTDEANRSAVPT
jgi:hypothetical protein